MRLYCFCFRTPLHYGTIRGTHVGREHELTLGVDARHRGNLAAVRRQISCCFTGLQAAATPSLTVWGGRGRQLSDVMAYDWTNLTIWVRMLTGRLLPGACGTRGNGMTGMTGRARAADGPRPSGRRGPCSRGVFWEPRGPRNGQIERLGGLDISRGAFPVGGCDIAPLGKRPAEGRPDIVLYWTGFSSRQTPLGSVREKVRRASASAVT